MGDYSPQEAFDRLHKGQLAQSNDVGKLWTHVLDLKKKIEKLEGKTTIKGPIYINVSEKTVAALN